MDLTHKKHVVKWQTLPVGVLNCDTAVSIRFLERLVSSRSCDLTSCGHPSCQGPKRAAKNNMCTSCGLYNTFIILRIVRKFSNGWQFDFSVIVTDAQCFFGHMTHSLMVADQQWSLIITIQERFKGFIFPFTSSHFPLRMRFPPLSTSLLSPSLKQGLWFLAKFFKICRFLHCLRLIVLGRLKVRIFSRRICEQL